MGADSRARTGIKTIDAGKGYADQFTILGLDITPEALKALYAGTRRHDYVCEVIDALYQLQRVKTKTAPRWLVNGMRPLSSAPPPIQVVDLNLDSNGRNWILVAEGRQRTMARRELDLECEAKGEPKREIRCIAEVFASKTAYKDALECRINGNLREAMTHSQRAEDAAALTRAGYSEEDIAPRCQATGGADEVKMLVALNACVDEVKIAIDAGKVPLADALILAKEDEEEQKRRILRKLAGTNGKAKNAAAPARAKTRRADVLRDAEAALRSVPNDAAYQWHDRLTPEDRSHYTIARLGDVADVLKWVRGETEAPEWLANAMADHKKRNLENI